MTAQVTHPGISCPRVNISSYLCAKSVLGRRLSSINLNYHFIRIQLSENEQVTLFQLLIVQCEEIPRIPLIGYRLLHIEISINKKY